MEYSNIALLEAIHHTKSHDKEILPSHHSHHIYGIFLSFKQKKKKKKKEKK